MNKYRIVYKEGKYYPQVRDVGFLFFKFWQTLTAYGDWELSGESSLEEAQRIIDQYELQINEKSHPKRYIEYSPKLPD